MRFSGKTTLYQYQAFGLKIASEIEIPELRPAGRGKADVHIIRGEAVVIEQAAKQLNYYRTAEHVFRFWEEGIAQYCVTAGREIVVHTYDHADPKEVRLCLLGTAMGVLLLQRGVLPLHGSAISRAIGCAIFIGECGAGKSTLANALSKNGNMLLADDIAAVHVERNKPSWVAPAYPQQKLWAESAQMMNIDVAGLERICEDLNKYNIPVNSTFSDTAGNVTAIYELRVKLGGKVTVTQLHGIEKLQTILNHTYRAPLIGQLGLQTEHFAKCAAIAEQVPVFCITRPEGQMSLEKIVDAFEKHFITRWNPFCNAEEGRTEECIQLI